LFLSFVFVATFFFIFLSLFDVFDLLFFVGFGLFLRNPGLDRACAWWKMPGAAMKVFRRPLNFPELF
jgi:hypothetical protein